MVADGSKREVGGKLWLQDGIEGLEMMETGILREPHIVVMGTTGVPVPLVLGSFPDSALISYLPPGCSSRVPPSLPTLGVRHLPTGD